MSYQNDILNRINISNKYSQTEWSTVVQQARYNLEHIPSYLSDQWELLKDRVYVGNVSDNDAVVITILGSRLIMSEKIDELYMTDDWYLLSENIDLEVKTKNLKSPKKLQVSRSLYKDDQWNKSVSLAKNILSKPPPPNFTEKWPILKSEEFRNRMKSIESNAVITLTIAMSLSKDQAIPCIFHTDDWELLDEMIKITKGVKN
jgi:hypothetical protein